ncbi:MAG TPA: TonB-dependent receptor [Caulobacteraceae bacterium]|jgi:vitamin B12 transporter|nr:TonB-dependent receptor [Caulobacteraceae bacterium]
MTKTVLFSSACFAILAATCAHADEAAAPRPDVGGVEAANTLDGTVVVATRSLQRADRIGQSVTVLDQKAIEAGQATVVADLLARTPGVGVSRNGGPGQLTTLRIRGAEGDQTVVVVDGVKLNDPSQPGGGYNFANLLTGDVSRVEVLRGAQSTLWGSQAIGGVVNIVTAQPTRPFEASLDLEGGSMDTAYLRAGVGGAGERGSWRLAAAHYATAGVSAYRFGKEADGFHDTGFSGRGNLKLTQDASLDLRLVYSKGRNAFDGFPPPAFAFADDGEYGTTEDLVGYGGLNAGLLGGRLQNRLSFGYTRTDRETFNPAQAVATTTFIARGQNKRYEYQGVLDIAPGWTGTAGVEREEASMRTAAPSAFAPNPVPATAQAAIDSLYGQVQGEVAPGLTLTGGLRHDDHDTFGGKTLGQAAAAWSLNGGATVLRASFGQGFKAPTLYQLFGPYGNTGLKPEQADGWDAGIEQALGGVRLTATYFARRTTNQIDFASCPSGGAAPALCSVGGTRRFGYYDNIARTRAHGVELAGAARLGPVDLQANYSWTDARNDVAGGVNFDRFLARRPQHQANVSAGRTWPGRLTTTVAVRYVGESFDDAANTVRLKGYTLVDLRASYPLSKGLELYGRVENLTDQAYETVHNYGEPGRTAYLGLRARY